MKKAFTTIGLFTLMLILTSFTAPQTATTIVDNNTSSETVNGSVTSLGSKKLDGSVTSLGSKKLDGSVTSLGSKKLDGSVTSLGSKKLD